MIIRIYHTSHVQFHINGKSDFWSNTFLTTLLQFPVCKRIYSGRSKKFHLPSLFATLQYWFIAPSSISWAWCSIGPFWAVTISSKKSCAWMNNQSDFHIVIPGFLTETFIYATQVRRIITLILLNKAIFSLFRID